VEEGLPPEHGGELLRDPLEQLLDGGRVSCRRRKNYVKLLSLAHTFENF